MFVGECPYNGEIGNTILYLHDIRKKGREYDYVFVADEVYSFSTTERIIKLASPIYSADCPAPVAVSATRMYLQTRKKWLDLPQNLVDNDKWWYNAYGLGGQLYEHEILQ